jgi:hypothetical protein
MGGNLVASPAACAAPAEVTWADMSMADTADRRPTLADERACAEKAGSERPVMSG